jgi:putative DNA primase/helicase
MIESLTNTRLKAKAHSKSVITLPGMRNAIDQFRAAIQSAGLIPPDIIEPDGKLHRFASNGTRGDDAGWYSLHGDGIPAGSFGDWRSGQSQTWRADIGRTPTPAEEAAHRAKIEAMRRQREAEKAREQTEAAGKAAAMWEAAKPAPHDHPYLVRKGIKPSGARLHNDALMIPVRDGGEIHSLQFIGPNGDKRFLTGGRLAGCYFSMGNPNGAAALCIAEGFATGATIHEATGYPVAVAFNAGNLVPVAKAMRERFAELRLIICADDDVATEGNPGITKATVAARFVGGLVAIPDFGNDRPQGATDFNDLAQHRGVQAVESTIANAIAQARTEPQPGANIEIVGDSDVDGWVEPQSLAVKVEPEPYPLDALPDTVRAAVFEVQRFTKAPIPLVASSSLAALSLAIQAHADAKRAEKLHGPVGLFLLTIADSGERKSTCDGFFMKAIRDYDARQADAAKPILKNYKAAIESWEAERDGIIVAIKQAAKTAKPVNGKDIRVLRAELAEHQHQQAEPPRIPRLIYADATPEALAYGLAHYWPSGGVVSAEGGLVFGSHGMGKDSIMRNLAMLNQLWDGNHLIIDRRTTESFTVKGVRLTMALQVQEPTLREFFIRVEPDIPARPAALRARELNRARELHRRGRMGRTGAARSRASLAGSPGRPATRANACGGADGTQSVVRSMLAAIAGHQLLGSGRIEILRAGSAAAFPACLHTGKRPARHRGSGIHSACRARAAGARPRIRFLRISGRHWDREVRRPTGLRRRIRTPDHQSLRALPLRYRRPRAYSRFRGKDPDAGISRTQRHGQRPVRRKVDRSIRTACVARFAAAFCSACARPGFSGLCIVARCNRSACAGSPCTCGQC